MATVYGPRLGKEVGWHIESKCWSLAGWERLADACLLVNPYPQPGDRKFLIVGYWG